MSYKDRVKCNILNSPGTSGNFQLGTPLAAFQGFSVADDGHKFDITALQGVDWEICHQCTYSYVSNTLTRGTLSASSTGSRINFTNSCQISGTINAGNFFDATISSPSVGQVLTYNGSTWVNAGVPGAGTSISTMSDVHLDSLATKDVLIYNGSYWVNTAITVSDVHDILLVSPTAGQALVYNGAYWTNSGVAETLSSLSDVDLTTLSLGQVLEWNGTHWVNASASNSSTLASDTDVSISSPAAHQILQFNGSYWINTYNNLANLNDVTIVASSDVNQLLTYNGSTQKFGNQNISLNFCTDVAVSSPANGQALVYNTSSGAWVNTAVTDTDALSALTDVALTSPTSGQVLTYSTITSKWTNTSITDTDSLSLLTDVTLGSLAANQLLMYNNSIGKWTNENIYGVYSIGILSDVGIVSPVNHQFLQYNGSQWTNHTLTLSDNTDVALTSLTNGQALTYNTSTSKWVNSTVASSVSTLTDVTLTSPSSGQVLEYNGTKWVNASLPTDTDTLAALNDVDLISLGDLQILQWFAAGSYWTNVIPTTALLRDVSVTSPSLAQVLRYDTVTSKWQNKHLSVITNDVVGINIGTPSFGQSLVWDGANFSNRFPYIAWSGDVNLTSPTDNQVLTYNASTSKWINQSLPTDTDSLSLLTDVTLTGLSNKQALVYNTSTSKWVNTDFKLSNLADCNISSTIPLGLYILKYSGTQWVGSTISLSDICISISSPTSGQVLTYDSMFGWKNASLPSDTDNLSLLADCIITSPSNGQILYYNGTKWVNSAITSLDPRIASNSFTTNPVAGSVGSLVIGDGATSTTVTYSTVIGAGTTASQNYGTVFGYSSYTYATSSLAVGYGAQVWASADYSISIGQGAQVRTSATHAISIGSSSTINANASNAIALGSGAIASGYATNSIAIGYASMTAGDSSVAIGNTAAASTANAVALGNNATVGTSTTNAIAIGSFTTAAKAGSAALGSYATTEFNGEHALSSGKPSATSKLPKVSFIPIWTATVPGAYLNVVFGTGDGTNSKANTGLTSTLTLAQNSIYILDIDICAIDQTFSSTSYFASYNLKLTVTTGTYATLQSHVLTTLINGSPSWTLPTPTVSGLNLSILCSGSSALSVNWTGNIKLTTAGAAA